MIFRWLKNRRRRKLLEQPVSEEWEQILRRNVAVYGLLGESEQVKLRETMRVLIAEKRWEGCAGLAMNDEIRVTIAGQAALLLIGLKHDYYRQLATVLVYPSGYLVPEQRRIGGGSLIVEEQLPVLGQACYRGPVVLSWEDALAGGRRAADGRNLVLHEFAHRLDMLDDLSDGTPPLASREQFEAWVKTMQQSYERLVFRAQTGRATLLDKYGATNPAEFFAVATEAFFEQPIALRRRHRDLYDALRGYYGQDPAQWFEE